MICLHFTHANFSVFIFGDLSMNREKQHFIFHKTRLASTVVIIILNYL